MRVAHCIVLFSFQNHSSSYEVHRQVFCLDLGIGPQNDAHVVSGTNCHSVSARTSLTIVLSRPLDALQRHLKIPLDFRTFAFFLTAIRNDRIKLVGTAYEIPSLTHRISSFHESSVTVTDRTSVERGKPSTVLDRLASCQST